MEASKLADEVQLVAGEEQGFFAAIGGGPGVAAAAIVGFFFVVMLRTRGILDLEQQFVFYASYHHDLANQVIHFVCIWPILWTAMVFFAQTPALLETPDALQASPIGGVFEDGAKLDWAAVVTVWYMIYYVLLERSVAGVAGASLVFWSYASASRFGASDEESWGLAPWRLALLGHVAAWILQFLGHAVCEKRSPAMTENPAQAFLMAPLFVLMEFFFILGYRPELHARAMKQVEARVAALKSQDALRAAKKAA